jgi:1,4-dihydroxy-6-naphthoate synthase
VTALSYHAYAHVHERYRILTAGASMGEGYGPVIVAREPLGPDRLAGLRVAVPGPWTSATLALRLFEPAVEPVPVPFDRIGEAVRSGEHPAGVLIHEGQLTWEGEGLHGVRDLGEWWRETTGLPLPLGCNAVRRDLPEELQRALARGLRDSVRHALDHPEEALDHALPYGRGLDRERARRFVAMYVNDRTLDLGEEGREAVRLFLRRGHEAGLLRSAPETDFLSP